MWNFARWIENSKYLQTSRAYATHTKKGGGSWETIALEEDLVVGKWIGVLKQMWKVVGHVILLKDLSLTYRLSFNRIFRGFSNIGYWQPRLGRAGEISSLSCFVAVGLRCQGPRSIKEKNHKALFTRGPDMSRSVTWSRCRSARDSISNVSHSFFCMTIFRLTVVLKRNSLQYDNR